MLSGMTKYKGLPKDKVDVNLTTLYGVIEHQKIDWYLTNEAALDRAQKKLSIIKVETFEGSNVHLEATYNNVTV